MSHQGEPSNVQDQAANVRLPGSTISAPDPMESDQEEELALPIKEVTRRLDYLLKELQDVKKNEKTLKAELGIATRRLDEAQAAPTPKNNKQEEIGRILKPTKPELFNGTASKLFTFLTQCRAYFAYFLTSLSTDADKVHYSAGRLTGNAATWFKPTLKEVLTTPKEQWSETTRTIYSSFSHFEEALQKNFGIIDKKIKAEIQIKKLRQTKSTSVYATTFLQHASKLS